MDTAIGSDSAAGCSDEACSGERRNFVPSQVMQLDGNAAVVSDETPLGVRRVLSAFVQDTALCDEASTDERQNFLSKDVRAKAAAIAVEDVSFPSNTHNTG